MQLVARFVAVEGKAEFGGAVLHPLEVHFELGDPLVGGEAHGFNEVELRGAASGRGTAGKGPLEQRFAPFGARLAIGDDRAAHAQHRLAAAVLDLGQPQGADRHVEGRIAACANPADSPAIGAARIALDRVEQFQGADLGGTRNRPAGEQRADEIDRAFALPKPGADHADHLVDGGIALDREGFVHPHAAGFGDTGEIVAHQIDDHQILGAILDRASELRSQRCIRLRIAAPRAGALHRLGLGHAILERNEQFGAEAEQPMRAVEYHPAIARLRRRAQRGIETQRIAGEIARQREGQIGLVDIARADRVLQRPESLRIAAR